MMKRKHLCRVACLLLAGFLLLPLSLPAFAASGSTARYTNPRTGYQVFLLDEADLLSSSEEAALIDSMIPITEYGHIIFWSTWENSSSEITQAKEMRYRLCGNDSSGIFAINMKLRKVSFQSDGEIYRFVSRSYARSITDNVSGYASSGEYARCAAEAYAQILTVLKGNRIAEPMKYISFIVIGLMLAFILVVGLAFSKRFNPLVKRRNMALRVESGTLVEDTPGFYHFSSRDRVWVIVLEGILRFIGRVILDGILDSASSKSDHSSSSGSRSSKGGGGGGSSSF